MGYGGALIWTGLARNLKKEFPDKKIIFVYTLSLKNILLLKRNPDFEIYTNNPDVTLVTNNFFAPLFALWFTKNKTIVVNLHEKKYHYWISDTSEKMVYRQDGHAITIACAAFQLSNVELKTRLQLTENEQVVVKKLLQKYNLSYKKYICIEPNAKKTFTANKQWPWQHWQEFTNILQTWIDEHAPDYKIVQIGAPQSPALTGVLQLTGKTTFRQVKEIIDHAAMVISNEGGVAHLAASSETVAIVIANPSLPPQLMTYPQHVTIFPPTGIHNCGLKKNCPICSDLLQSITPTVVFEKTTAVIEKLLYI